MRAYFRVPEHHGDGSALPRLIQGNTLGLEIWSSGGCRFIRIRARSFHLERL
ncbi:MAG: hypothetical protein ACREDM_09370 [Methylocella sp.]